MNKIKRLLFTFVSLLTAIVSLADIPEGQYAIEITLSAHGSVVVSEPANAQSSLPGMTITLTVTSDEGYYLSKLTVTPYAEEAQARIHTRADGPTMLSVIPITSNADGTFSFIMPNKKVVISAEFSEGVSIGDATVTLNEVSHVYDWMSHTPSISSVVINNVQLFEGKDYTVSSLKDVIPSGKTENDAEAWDNGITSITNVGTRKIKLTGIGLYKSHRIVEYSITQRSIADAKINLSKSSFVYLKNQKQIAEITGGVYLNGQEIIQNPTNGYTYVRYYVGDYSSSDLPTATESIFTSDNITSKDVGTYTISITGVGNFTGTAKTTYQITARDISTCTIGGTTSFTYNNNVQSPNNTNLIVSDDGGTLGSSDYTITYKTGETTWAAEATSKEIGTYYMKLTGAGPNYTGSVEVPYYITSIGAEISSVGGVDYTTPESIYETTYTGSKITPTIVVKDGSVTLTADTHYSVEYYNNTNVGVATVSVTGKSPYNFHLSKDFRITPKELMADMITLSGYTAKKETSDDANNCFKYNGTIQKPTVTIADGTALKSSDYTITNNGGTNKGTYEVIVVGQNNYKTTSQISIPYDIIQNSLTGASITLSAKSAIYNGSEIKPDVLLVKTSDGVIATVTDYDVTYTDNTDQGTATVKVKAKHTGTEGNETYTGNFKDYATTTFTIDKKPVSNLIITLDATSFSYDGTVKKPTVTVKDGGILTVGDPTPLTENTDYSLSYNGATTASSIAVGSYTVTITGIGNYTGSVDKTYVINYGTSDSDFTITVSGTYTYNGEAHEPVGTGDSPAVVVKKGTTILTAGTDYSLKYQDNINAGTATVIATGAGNYQFIQTGTFTINPKPLTVGMVTFTPNTFVYNGSVQKPTVVVADGGTLVEGTDYTLTNNGATNVSTGNTVTIVGKGNYSGTLNSETANMPTYSITALDISSTSANNVEITLYPLSDATYSGSPKTPSVQQVKVNDIVFTSGYTVAYENNTDVATSTIKPTVKVTGTGNLTGTATTTFVIDPKPLTDDMVTLGYTSTPFDNTPKEPSVTITDTSLPGDSKIVPASNYSVSYTADHTSQGTKTVTIVGKNNYKGTIYKSYTITGSTGFEVAFTTTPSFTYDGTAKTPAVNVTKTETSDALDAEDYSVSYLNNINAGTATVRITGTRNYSGTLTLDFTINKKPMTDDMLTLTGEPFTYNGSVQKPTATVSDIACPITTNDYVINNEGNINAGTHTVTATATDTGNYSGSSSKTYTISPYALITENTTITLNQTSLVYDGTAKTPEVQLVKVGSDLVVPTYTTVYANNTNAAAATATIAPQVTVTGTGNFTGSAVKKFTITPKTVTTDMILFDQENFTYNAAVQKPVVTVKDGNKTLTENTDYTLTNEGGTNIGTYYAQIEGKGNYQGTAKRGYSIVTDGASMFTVNDIESVTYDGTEKTPEVVVLDNVKTAGTTLTENVHYTKNYINNKNAGIASVIITGIGSYAGTITKNFTINPKALTEEMVVLAENSFAFNSLQQKPTVTVSDGTIMTENDYTITNNGGVNCGTYHVVVTGKGNYTGEIDKTFTITQLDISTGTVTLYELQSYAYDGKPKKPGVREIIVGKVTVPTTGYTTSYGDNINVGKGTVTVTGQGDFRGTKTVEFEIIKKTITADMITLSNQEYTYNGSTHKPEVTVKDGETTLKLGTDYTLTNNGGVNAGTYDVTITGIGNYTGSVTKNFTIRVQEAGVFVMSLSQESMVFTGSELKPVVMVKDSEKTLTEGTHYTVTYNNNINVGVATVMVEGIGQYKGSKMKTFIITPKTLTDAMVTLSSSEFTYNVMQQRPVVTVQDGSSLTLNDYVVTNDGGVNVGTYKVTVIGKNNYMGSVEKSFSISSLDISEAKVILYELANYVYDGTAKNPGVREVGIGTIVVPTSSYTSEISDNVNAGKVTVTVTGSGNFSGSASTSFNILQKPLSEEMVSLDKTSFPYNEKKQKPVVTVSDGNIMTEADYTITNEGGTEEGTYDVIVTGKNNYTGTITKKYDIIRSDMPVDVKPGDENPSADDATISVTPVSKGSNEVKVSDIKTTESESVTIPETCTINGQTYTITGIADGAFANASNLKDLYLPETEEPLTIGKDAIPAAANVHVPLSLLAQYALMPAMAENFRNGKVMTTVKAKNRYWTFSSGVDVYVPEGLDVYIAREHNDYSVSIIQLTDNELAVGGQRVIKANNGVLINSSGNDTPYTFVACPKRMTSGTAITTDDNKDYGLRNCLIPVIVATHFESGNYYFMKNNEFYRITDESEDIKVPAGKAVLYLKSAKASARVRLVNGTTDISSETIEDQQDEWYTIEGLKLDGRPTKEGIYIHNKKKVYIRK